MFQTVKKLFEWTENDIAAWERIRQKGLRRFMVWYGLSFSGIMFLVMGAVTFFTWKPASLVSLLFQSVIVAIVCLLGGLITSLVTWWMEDGIYRKIVKSR